MLVVPDEPVGGGERGVWDDFCIANMEYVDYGGLPFNEVVFWGEEGVLELPAWRVKLSKSGGNKGGEGTVERIHVDL